MNPKHQKFCELVASGLTQEAAYLQVTDRKPTNKTARINGNKLATKYASEIAEIKERRRIAVEQAQSSDAAKQALKAILTEAEIDSFLSAVVRGDENLDNLAFIQRSRQMTTVKQAPVKPSLRDKVKAAELLYKRKGSLIDKTDITSGGNPIEIKTSVEIIHTKK